MRNATGRVVTKDMDRLHIRDEYGTVLAISDDDDGDICISIDSTSDGQEMHCWMKIDEDEISNLHDYFHDHDLRRDDRLTCKSCGSDNLRFVGQSSGLLQVHCNMCAAVGPYEG